MRTPLDAFHQALVNLVEERRRTEQPVRRRRRVGVGNEVSDGTQVKVHIPANLQGHHRQLVRFHGRIGVTTGTVKFQPHQVGSTYVLFADEWDPVSLPLTFLELMDPPPTSNSIEEIEAWLAS